ncbi:hypothetical protein P7C73_g6502, partial [Tremellales sp. Uapishka_1]
MADPATPARAKLAHSHSTPLLPSTSTPSQHVQSPGTKSPHPQNFHPYLIQTTSSSLLTRSNSSPSQPPANLSRHRPSRSMSSLAGVEERRAGEAEAEPRVPQGGGGMKRSGTLPDFLKEKGKEEKELDLPINPKLWSPSELAQYIVYTLRTGGPDGTGQVLPAPLVEDIKTWVLRQQVTGRMFVKGSGDIWGNTSRPPPFLPTLSALSRRLRRSSFQGRLPPLPHTALPVPGDGSPLSRHSVLMEEDDEDGEEEITGVRKMANVFEPKDSTSESGEEVALRAQWTGGSTSSEVETRWGLRRTNTGGSGTYHPFGRKRRESGVSVGAMADVEKEVPKQLAVLPGTSETSPPPPYASPNPEQQGSPSPSPATPREDDDTPAPGISLSTGTIRSRSSTPSRTSVAAVPGGASSGDDRLLPSRGAQMWDEADLEGSRWTTAKRINLKPNRVEGIFETPPPGSTHSTPSARRSKHARTASQSQSKREREMEGQMGVLMDRIKELETRLVTVEREREHSRPASPSPLSSSVSHPVSPSPGYSEQILRSLGIGTAVDDDGLPTRIRELPGYLFLVGVGVGAVIVKVLIRVGR